MSIETLFAHARAAISTGRKEEGRSLLISIIHEDPDFAPAWLWLSGVLEEPEKRRDCLQRVLELEPTNEAALMGLEFLRLQIVVDQTPPAPPVEKSVAVVKRLGEYLVEQKFIKQIQLDAALSEQAQEARYGRIVPLGDILLRRRWLTTQALGKVLEVQKMARAQGGHASTINRLGEHLIEQGLITRTQLNQVIARQADLKVRGQNFQVGELLVLSGMLSRDQLQQAINEQQHTFMNELPQR